MPVLNPAWLHRASVLSRAPGTEIETGPDGWGRIALPDGRVLHLRGDYWRAVREGRMMDATQNPAPPPHRAVSDAAGVATPGNAETPLADLNSRAAYGEGV